MVKMLFWWICIKFFLWF